MVRWCLEITRVFYLYVHHHKWGRGWGCCSSRVVTRSSQPTDGACNRWRLPACRRRLPANRWRLPATLLQLLSLQLFGVYCLSGRRSGRLATRHSGIAYAPAPHTASALASATALPLVPVTAAAAVHQIGPKLLKFIPGKKVRDLRNWLTVYGYWNQGGSQNVSSMFLYLANEYLMDIDIQPKAVKETPPLGVPPAAEGLFPSVSATILTEICCSKGLQRLALTKCDEAPS